MRSAYDELESLARDRDVLTAPQSALVVNLRNVLEPMGPVAEAQPVQVRSRAEPVTRPG